MPLLGKNRFKSQPIPENLSPTDEVYVCKATGEVFTDYEKFFDQTILCNSLIWSCEVTGHGGMTFTEALESEKSSKKQLESFPPTLHLPILHLVSLTCRTIFKDLLDDIFGFSKDRYFIGETVTVSSGNEKKNAVVIKVFPPASPSPSKSDSANVDDFRKGHPKSSSRKPISDAASFQYMSQDQNTGITLMSNSKNMSRSRNLFNRDSCRLFLKEHCEHKGKGVWRLKDSVIAQYNLENVKFSDYFAGSAPSFPGTDEVESKSGVDVTTTSSVVATAVATSATTTATVTNSEKKEVSAKKKEAERAKDWLKSRDDLLCDDLKDLPLARQVTLLSEHFGPAIMVMEFLNCFKSFCGIELPAGFSITDLEKCLKEQSGESAFVDLVHQLLTAIFQMQLGLPELNQNWKAASKSDAEMQSSLSLIRFFQSVEKKSKSQKSQFIYETPLRQVPLDSSSVTEILRIHLHVGYYDASIASSDVVTPEVRVEQKGSEFSRSNPEIMKKLMQGNVVDLSPGEKLKVLSYLIDQVLGLPGCRDFIEESCSRLKNVQRDLRAHMWAVQRREKDYLNYNFKKKQEEDTQASDKKKESSSKAQDSSAAKTKKKSILDLKDKDFEEMPMEGIDWDQLSQEEKDHIKSWSDRRHAELQSAVEAAQADCFLVPIGTDRTYRRYWMFRSTAGLFVEDSPSQEFSVPTSCLAVVAQDRNRLTTIDKYFGPMKDDDDEDDKKPLKYVNVLDQLARRGKVEWSVYSSPPELDALVERLNVRGHREAHLRLFLLRWKEKILASMGSCNVVGLCGPDKETEISAPNGAECSDDATQGEKGELELARTLADMLLDLEDRVFSGCLGQLKLSNNIERIEWRKSVENIDGSVEENGFLSTSNGDSHDVDREDDGDDRMKRVRKHLGRCLVEVMEMVEPRYLNPPLCDDEETKLKKLKLLSEQQQHSVEATEKVDDADDALPLHEPPTNHLAGNSHNYNGSNNNNNLSNRTDAAKWKELVQKCTNFSQLYLCLVLLDTAITWSKSSLNARCRICRRKKDGENMLLCDGCDQGHHMYCLKPPLKKVPEGDWYCPTCQPKNLIILSPRKSTKNVRYKDYDSDFAEEDEESRSSTEQSRLNDSMDWGDSSKVDKRKKTKEKHVKKSNGAGNKRSDAFCDSAPGLSSAMPTEKSPTSASVNVVKSRSGREIIRPKINDHFVEDSPPPPSKVRKRDRSDESYMDSRKKRQVKSSRYMDDFDYDNNDGDDDDDEEEEEEEEEEDEDEYSRRRSNRKRKSAKNSSKIYENDTPPSKRTAPIAQKHSQRKSNVSMKAVEDLVTELMKEDNAWPFLKPVTVKQAPDYFDIVEKPMDLSTIKYKIYRFEYEDQNQIIDDLRLMLYNCNLYNCPDTPVHDAGRALETYLDRRLEEIEKGHAATFNNSSSTNNSSTRLSTRKRTSQ